MISTARHTLVAVSVAALALGTVAGCSSEGAQTDCSTSACTITFDRTAETARVSVLGIDARLVSVQGNRAKLEVAGSQISVPVDGQAQAGDFTVTVQEVTDGEVVAKVSRSGGG